MRATATRDAAARPVPLDGEHRTVPAAPRLDLRHLTAAADGWESLGRPGAVVLTVATEPGVVEQATVGDLLRRRRLAGLTTPSRSATPAAANSSPRSPKPPDATPPRRRG